MKTLQDIIEEVGYKPKKYQNNILSYVDENPPRSFIEIRKLLSTDELKEEWYTAIENFGINGYTIYFPSIEYKD